VKSNAHISEYKVFFFKSVFKKCRGSGGRWGREDVGRKIVEKWVTSELGVSSTTQLTS
jgi:hypothetical protein